MKDVISVLITLLMLVHCFPSAAFATADISDNSTAAQFSSNENADDFSIEGEWYSVNLYGAPFWDAEVDEDGTYRVYHNYKKLEIDDNGTYHLNDQYGDFPVYQDGKIMEIDDWNMVQPEYVVQPHEDITIFYKEPDEDEVDADYLDGIIFIKSDNRWFCVRLFYATPALFTSEKLIEYSKTGDEVEYFLTGDSLYLITGEKGYMRGKIEPYGNDVFLYYVPDEASDEYEVPDDAPPFIRIPTVVLFRTSIVK